MARSDSAPLACSSAITGRPVRRPPARRAMPSAGKRTEIQIERKPSLTRPNLYDLVRALGDLRLRGLPGDQGRIRASAIRATQRLWNLRTSDRRGSDPSVAGRTLAVSLPRTEDMTRQPCRRSITGATCTADHCPAPRAVGMPRAFNPAAMARSDSAPAACSSANNPRKGRRRPPPRLAGPAAPPLALRFLRSRVKLIKRIGQPPFGPPKLIGIRLKFPLSLLGRRANSVEVCGGEIVGRLMLAKLQFGLNVLATRVVPRFHPTISPSLHFA
jgi:hypothetical protein